MGSGFVARPSNWLILRSVRFNAPKSRLGRLLPTLIPQLIELGLASAEQGVLRISHADFAALETHGIDAFDTVVPWAPFTSVLARIDPVSLTRIDPGADLNCGTQS
jgi:hypothetical protein